MEENDLEIYVAYLTNLQGLARKKISGIKFPEDDDFAFMGISTMIKQISHADAILKFETHPDTNLIARSMLETSFQYLWVNLEPQERSRKYRGFALIHDWRMIQKKKLNNEEFSEKREANIIAGLEYYGDLLKLKVKEGNPIKTNDPYHTDWKAGKHISKIFKEVIKSRPLPQSYFRSNMR